MDFEQLRKDMEDGTDGPWETAEEYREDLGCVHIWIGTMRWITRIARVVVYGEPVCEHEANARRIARVPDLERIALAAEKYRKATVAYASSDGKADSICASLAVKEARDELFALLASKDAT